MEKIKAIIFDFGGVVFPESIHLVSQRAAKELGFDWISFAALQKKYGHEVMKGKMSFVQVLRMLKDEQKISHSLEDMLALWEEAYFDILKPNKPLISLIKKLRKRYTVALVSNIYDTTARHHKKHGHLDYFDPCILSCDVGMEKPDEDIFRLALKKLKLSAKECIFIDDKLSNCDAAASLGFHAVQFVGNKKLVADVKSMGVVV